MQNDNKRNSLIKEIYDEEYWDLYDDDMESDGQTDYSKMDIYMGIFGAVLFFAIITFVVLVVF